ncbi:MAG TPA: hypothetical protein VFQ53_10535 [Kofleriaceae bacterium]|nr:hypothetical protein [Kofleriaceae bacterium]
MRWPLACVLIASCSGGPQAVPPKRPNNELIVGDFARKPPDGETAVRFGSDGSFFTAKTKGELEHTPHLAEGTYKLDGDQLTFSNARGQCTESEGDKVGTYKVVVSRVGIRFSKVTDSCEARSRLDGQTWWRIK